MRQGHGSGVSGNAGNAHIWQEPPAGTWHQSRRSPARAIKPSKYISDTTAAKSAPPKKKLEKSPRIYKLAPPFAKSTGKRQAYNTIADHLQIAPAAEDTLPSRSMQAVDGVPHRIICLLNQLLTAGVGQLAQVHRFMEENSEKQARLYVEPEVELVDIYPAGVICTSGSTTGEDPDYPIYF